MKNSNQEKNPIVGQFRLDQRNGVFSFSKQKKYQTLNDVFIFSFKSEHSGGNENDALHNILLEVWI